MAKSKRKTKQNQLFEVWGLAIIAMSAIALLSIISYTVSQAGHNWLGFIGNILGITFHNLFGVVSFLIPIFGFLLGARLLFSTPPSALKGKIIFAGSIFVSLAMLLTVLEDAYPLLKRDLHAFFYPYWTSKRVTFHLGGYPGFYLYKELPIINLKHMINAMGVVLLFSTLLLGSALYLFKTPLTLLANKLKWLGMDLIDKLKQRKLNKETKEKPNHMRFVNLKIPQMGKKEKIAIQPKKLEEKVSKIPEPAIRLSESPPMPKTFEKKEIGSTSRKFSLPPLNLLTSPKPVDQTHLKRDLKKQAEVLEETLLSFGIEAKVGQINCGPTITSFEVHPAIGVKVQKIKTLSNDIALNMEAESIRIIAPIPGKAAVGIEVPNLYPQEVGFKEMLQTFRQMPKKAKIPLLLGKAVNGDYVMSDLTKMPHCIIAGATGSGKSVCINTIVMAILYSLRPDEVRLLMIDPKKVELTPYSKLPHMIAPVITEPHGAANALNWLVREMELRYEILKQTHVRNIEGFNHRKANKKVEDELSIEIPEKMPYIVAIIDELADLMMVSSSSDIETPIARMAQMARAVGIHLILATQRPSREVITGLIKANFPTRISFKVASRINSQIVLDDVGAETLLGNGDMLFLPPGTSQLVRAQGAFIRDEDIHRVIELIEANSTPDYLINSFDDMIGLMPSQEEDIEKDSLFHDALKIIQAHQNASTTFLQRKLKIGYARAASLMDQLEDNGYVSSQDGSKPRKVLKP